MTTSTLQLEINTLPLDFKKKVIEYVSRLKAQAKAKTRLKVREFGYAKGMVKLAVDFDAPLADFKEYT